MGIWTAYEKSSPSDNDTFLLWDDGTNAIVQIDAYRMKQYMNTNLADQFSESSVYAVGDYCVRNGGLYRCISDVSSAGTWQSSKWEMVRITDVMGNASSSSQANMKFLDNSRFASLFEIDDTTGNVQVTPQSFNIAKSLTGCALDNNLTQVEEGSQYIANLSSTLTSYGSNVTYTVTVKMGDVDVTNSVYKYGTINISSVTGAISIVAKAVPNKYGVSFIGNGNVTYTELGLIEHGSSVTFTVKPSSGYTVQFISCQMGTQDINVSTITDGYSVTISSVTSDVTVSYTTKATNTTVDPYEIALNLTGNDSSNLAETINPGEEYRTTITPKSGWTPSGALVLTMGGKDVTSQYVTGTSTQANIYIPSVTGDIVITANGVQSASSTETQNVAITKNFTNAQFTSDQSTVTVGSALNKTISYTGTLSKYSVSMGGVTLTNALTLNETNKTITLSISSVTSAIAVTVVASGDSSTSQTSDSSVKLSNPVANSGSNALSAAGMIVEWDAVWFGSYPQKEIVPSSSYVGYTDSVQGSSHDAIIDATLYNQLGSATGWSNNILTLNGVKYKRIQKSDAIRTGTDSAYNYIWSKNTAQYHFFKFEPIKWRVLNVNGNNALLLADEILDASKYNEATKTGLTWEDSGVRTFCNGIFYNTAFTSTEKNAIQNVSVQNNDSVDYGSCTSGSATTDKVHLLSVAEMWGNTELAHSYGFYGVQAPSKEQSRMAYSTTYARARGCLIHGASFQWLRSTKNSTSKQGCYCCAVGRVVVGSDYSEVTQDEFGIRPVIKLDLSKGLHSYAGTVKSNRTNNTSTQIEPNSVSTTETTDTLNGSTSDDSIVSGDSSAVTSTSYGTKSSYATLVSNATNVINVKSWKTGDSNAAKAGKSLKSNTEYNGYYVKSTADQTPEWYATNSQTAPSGTKASNTYGFYVVGSSTTSLENVTIKNCVFENCTGIMSAYVNTMTIENCYFKGAEQGVYMGMNAKNITIKNCTFEMNDTNITNYIQGIYMKDGCHNIVVEDCLFIANGYVKVAFRSGSGGSVADPTSGVRFKHCKVTGKWCWAIQVLEGTDIQINDCEFDFLARKTNGFPTEGVSFCAVSLNTSNQIGLTFNRCTAKSTDNIKTMSQNRATFNACTFTNITKGSGTYDSDCVFK